jgi:UDP-2,3-diacylglucosamine hydrolase
MFGILPPYVGMGLADYFSRKSRKVAEEKEQHFVSEDDEWLFTYSKELLKKKHYDYFIFGHRHIPLDLPLSINSRYINLGDWLRYYTYAVFDGQKLVLQALEPTMESKIIRK